MTGRRGSWRVLILTAEVGEGHVAAARALAADLAEARPDAEIEIGDALDALGTPLRKILLDAYRWQLRRAPWLFSALFALFARTRLLRALGAAGLALLGARSLRAFVARHAPDVVVSTYPAATSVLGHLRRRGRIDQAAYATITDLDGVSFWAHRGIDLHLVMHEALVRDVERTAGPRSAVCVRPLVAAPFFTPLSRRAARRALDLGERGTLVVVSGGGWGVGDLDGAVRTALELPATSVVCLAGRDRDVRVRLEAAFAHEPRVQVLGFTERMPDLLAAADVLIHSTGGVTCLEALATGCPIVAYGAPPGHARVTARKLAELGLGRHARTRDELRSALTATLAGPRSRSVGAEPAVSAAAFVLDEPRRPVRPLARPVGRRARVLVGVAAALAVAGWTLANDTAYPLAARLLELEPLSQVSTTRPEVGLVVRAARPASALAAAAALSDGGDRASFAFAASPGTRSLARLSAAGDEAVPVLAPGGLTGWVVADDHLRDALRALGSRRDRLYLPPRDGFSIGEELVARADGFHPTAAAVTYRSGTAPPRSLRAGEVVALDLPADSARARSIVGAFLRDASRHGLRAVTLSTLVADRTT